MTQAWYVRRFVFYFSFFMGLCTSGCNAHDTPSTWTVDCVGRMQLSFPGEVDVASTTLRDLKKPSDPPRFSFTDGQAAPWAGLVYLGSIRVIHGMSAYEIDTFMSEQRKGRNFFRIAADKARLTGQAHDVYKDLSVGVSDGFAFQAQGQNFLTLRLTEQVFTWGGYSGLEEKAAQKIYLEILEGVRARGPYSVPRESGICLPYAFIRDIGNPPRSISMVYRLRDHPDITVMLRDENASEFDPRARPDIYDPQDNADSFWSRYDSTYRQSLKSVWSEPYRRIKLANSKGVESFAKIVREGGEVDYGYLVVARGDPKSQEDTPDLMLYVIQNSKNAKARGIEPMGRDAFLTMAQTIAASVKRRPTSP